MCTKNNKSQTAKEHGLLKLRERVERLNIILQHKTPDVIIASEIVMIMKAATLYIPTALGTAMMSDMHNSASRSAGFCIKCGFLITKGNTIGEVPSATTMDEYCQKCEEALFNTLED